MERAPTQQANPQAILARCGDEVLTTVGNAPIRGFLYKAGLFDDQTLVLADSTVYLLDTSGASTPIPGSVPGSSWVEFDSGQDADLNSEAYIATGDELYRVTTAGVTIEDFPDTSRPGASSVCCHRGFVIATVAGTDQAYVKIPGDTTWAALSFVSAEYKPDPLEWVRSRGDQIVLGGKSTVEVWALSASATPPLAPYGGLNFDFGGRSRTAAVNVGGVLIYVDTNCQVRKFEGSEAAIISNNGLSEQIRKCAPGDMRASGYLKDGHAYFLLTLGTAATWVYDLSTDSWARASSAGLDYYRAQLFASVGDTILAADGQNNSIYQLDSGVRADAGVAFAVEFMAFAEVLEGIIPCANLQLACEVGHSPRAGAASDPLIAMRYSDDQGESWSDWRYRPLGKTGQSATLVRWNALGDIKSPYGRIFHFRVSDPVGRRFSSLSINVP